MEGLVFLVIIAMVVRSLYRNSKEAQRKEAERRQARGEAPMPQPKAKPRHGLPGSLPEWIEMLEGKASMDREARPAPAMPATSPDPHAYVPQGVSTEGCQTFQRDCEAPHHTLRVEKRQEVRTPPTEVRSPFSALEGMPEAMKGVVYAEILTRPQQRRRLRP